MELLNSLKNLSIQPVDEGTQRFLKNVAADIDSVHTEVVLAEYSDKTLIIVSQYHTIGSAVAVSKDQVHNPLGTNDIYSTRVIFGVVGEQELVAARFLAEALSINKPLIIFLNLKSYDIETVKACRDIILDLKEE